VIKHHALCVAVAALCAACASTAPVTTTRWIGTGRIFSGSARAEGAPVTRTRTDIYAHLSATDSQYVGTTFHNDASEAAVTAGKRTIESAVSRDGRTILFLHDARVAPRDAGLESGIYQYTLGQGRTPVRSPAMGQPFVRWDWLGARQRAFPSDILPVGVDTIWGLRVGAPTEPFPLILLGANALHRAAFEGRTDECARLVAGGAPINAETEWGDTPLSLAIILRHPETAIRLLELGANPSAGAPALPLATLFGDLPVIEAILSYGGRINVADRDGNTALHLAVLAALFGAQNNFFREAESPIAVMTRNITPRLINLLLDRGADAAARNKDGETPLDLIKSRHKAPVAVPPESEIARYDRFIAEVERLLRVRAQQSNRVP